MSDKVMPPEGSFAVPELPIGIPKMYPHAYGPAIPSAPLRPTKNMLFDTEIYDYDRAMTQQKKENNTAFRLRFFDRPIGHGMQLFPEVIKTEHEARLNQPRQLDRPCEFSIIGFNFFAEEGLSDQDRAAIINGGLFLFLCQGNRIYGNIPLIRMPRDSKKTDFELMMREYDRARLTEFKTVCEDKALTKAFEEMIETGRGLTEDEAQAFHDWTTREAAKLTDALKQRSMYSFTIGRSALRISLQDFFVQVSWMKPPKVLKPVRLMVFIEGLFWIPL